MHPTPPPRPTRWLILAWLASNPGPHAQEDIATGITGKVSHDTLAALAKAGWLTRAPDTEQVKGRPRILWGMVAKHVKLTQTHVAALRDDLQG